MNMKARAEVKETSVGDHASERRLGKTRKSMDKNPIQGRPGWVSWHNTAKPFDLARQVNAAAVQRSNVPLPGEISPAQADARTHLLDT
jgi:hypothetical protein